MAIDSKVWGRGKAESQWGGGQVLTGPNSGGKFSKLTSKNKNKTKQKNYFERLLRSCLLNDLHDKTEIHLIRSGKAGGVPTL